MKNKKIKIVGAAVLAVLVCAAIVAGVWHLAGRMSHNEGSKATQSVTDATNPVEQPKKEFRPEKFVELQKVLGKNEQMQAYHVLGDGKKILFLNWISTPEYMESPIYLWDRETGRKQVLSLGDYIASDVAWNGSELFITGMKKDSGTGLALFAGQIGDGAVEGIRQIICQDSDIQVFHCFAVWENRILFRSKDGNVYLGILREDRIQDVQELDMGSVKGKISDGYFIQDGSKLLVNIGVEYEGKDV